MPLREKGMRHPPPTSLLRAKGIAPLALISQSAPLGLGIGMRRATAKGEIHKKEWKRIKVGGETSVVFINYLLMVFSPYLYLFFLILLQRYFLLLFFIFSLIRLTFLINPFS